MFPLPDTAEFVAGKILEGLNSGALRFFVHDWMKNPTFSLLSLPIRCLLTLSEAEWSPCLGES